MDTCIWCGQTRQDVDKDHIFPRSIGGTKQLSVPACRECQIAIGKAEHELARRSEYGLFLIEDGPKGRNRQRPASGVIQARYVLVPHPLGGYNETEFKAGELGHSLPYIEIEPTRCLARVRASSPEVLDRLVSKAKKLLSNRPGPGQLVCEFDVKTDNLGAIGEDPEFWPRIVLDSRGKLFIRARNPEESIKFLNVFVPALFADSFEKHDNWKSAEIKGGTTHMVAVSYNVALVSRVLAKIACGLLFTTLGPAFYTKPGFTQIRAFVRGEREDEWRNWVDELDRPGTLSLWPKYHAAAIVQQDETLTAFVSLCGALHKIKLGPVPLEYGLPFVCARSHINGSKTELLAADEAENTIQILLRSCGMLNPAVKQTPQLKLERVENE